MSIMTDDALPNGTRRVWTICDNDAHAAAMHAAMMRVCRAAYQPQPVPAPTAEPRAPLLPAFDDPEPGVHPYHHEDATDGLLAGSANG